MKRSPGFCGVPAIVFPGSRRFVAATRAVSACSLVTRVVAEGILAGRQRVTPAEMRGNGAGAAAPPPPEPAEEPSVPEGDYEQVSPGEEPVAEAPTDSQEAATDSAEVES